jgi:hypothetical protein
MAEINLDQFVALYKDQSVLFNTNDKSLRGQCVQLVCFYCIDVVGSSVMWADAKEWWTKFSLDQWYDKIPYPGNLPKRGDIVVWDGDVPGSAGAGHIDICLQDGSQGSFLGFDSNWNGKTAHTVQHTYQYVLGFLRPKEQIMQEKKDYPDKGNLANIHDETGWPGHPINANDEAYWCSGTGNKWWGNVNDVWTTLTIEVGKWSKTNAATGPNCTPEERAFLDLRKKI